MPNPAWVGRLISQSWRQAPRFFKGLTGYTYKRRNRAPRKERCFIPERLKSNNKQCDLV